MASESNAEKANPKAPWPAPVLWAVRLAIAAVALWNLWDFVDWLPSLSVPDYGKATIYSLQNSAFVFIINPLCSLTALVLAAQGRRLKLAAILAAVPTLHFWAGVIAFGIGVMIYGF